MSTPAPKRRGPRPGAGTATREAIAAAARLEFAERGFAGATIRSIATRAGVDPALVHHYFGTKQALFREVLALAVAPIQAALPTVLDGPREAAGQRMVRTMLALYDDPGFREPVLAIIRTAMTDRQTAAMAATFLQEAILPRVAPLAVGPEPEARVALAITSLVGTMLGRHVLGLAALQAPAEDLVAELGPVVQRYLDGTHKG